MNDLKAEALESLKEIFDTIPYDVYSKIFDALSYIATLDERDQLLEELWGELADVPVDPETEKLEAPYLHFPVGTDKFDVWKWFDERHSKGVRYLLYRVEE